MRGQFCTVKTHPSPNTNSTLIEQSRASVSSSVCLFPSGIRAACLPGQHAQWEQPRWLDSPSFA